MFDENLLFRLRLCFLHNIWRFSEKQRILCAPPPSPPLFLMTMVIREKTKIIKLSLNDVHFYLWKYLKNCLKYWVIWTSIRTNFEKTFLDKFCAVELILLMLSCYLTKLDTSIYLGNKKDTLPSVKVIPTLVSVKINEEVKLYCSAKGVPNPKVYWTKGNNDKRISSKPYLHIEYLKETDGGEVHCHAYNRKGSSKVTATINIISKYHQQRFLSNIFFVTDYLISLL